MQHATQMATVVILLSAAALIGVGDALVQGNCTVYTNASTNCADANCGQCKNPGGRPGLICQGASTGYYCAPDNPSAGTAYPNMAFACMDWTFGSSAMRSAEAAYHERTGDSVYLGVGTYGTSSDAMRGLGACVKLQVPGVDRPLLLQSINTGSDVTGNQFDLQIGDGGAGAFNTCAGSSTSMYPGSYEAWGHQYGGVDHRSQCSSLPMYPQRAAAMKAANDSLVGLCEYSFDKKVRGEGGSNPSIQSITRVACPPELVHFTQLQRTDEPTAPMPTMMAEHQCGLDKPGGTAAWCLTRMMDCRKPSGGFVDNVKPNLVAAGKRVVQPCAADGYTRIDVQCGCKDCYC